MRLPLIAVVLLSFAPSVHAADPPRDPAKEIAGLVAAYPDHFAKSDGNELVWKDGTRMPIDDGKGEKAVERILDLADIEDMFRFRYRLGKAGLPPNVDDDPGRVRYQPLFTKMYGDCKKDEVEPRMAEIAWLPNRGGGKVKITTVNGVDKALAKVSAELDALPEKYTKYLVPNSGTYNCRVIAGTKRLSMHAYGASIDLNTAHTSYWQWNKPSEGGVYFWQNEIPMEIVEIFEKHGFIWGGRWYHYDTMHFEYRPEILATAIPEATQ
jgi:D-alanyl-D-alanine carboxypeptidase